VKYRFANWRRGLDGNWIFVPAGQNVTFEIDGTTEGGAA
jgi:hypothetical protein